MISLAQLSSAITDKIVQNGEKTDITNLIAGKLPAYLGDLTDFFSKKDSNKLPPHREGIDIAVELTGTLP